MADEGWRAAWAEAPCPDPVTPHAAGTAADRLLSAARQGGAAAANDIDTVLLAALEASVPPGPPLHSEYKQSYRGSEPRADCVEHALRSLIDRLAWCPETGSLDPARLPPTTLASVRGFYEQGGGEGDDADRALRWFGVCADLPADLEYLQTNEWGRYELAPSAENLQAAASALLGQPLAELLRCRVEPAELTRGPGAGHVFGSMLTVGGGRGQPAPLTVVLQPTQNHCFTLYAEPPRPEWVASAAADWAGAWASGALDSHPVLRLLAQRLAGGEPMMAAATAPHQALEAVLAAPLAQTEVRIQALELVKRHSLDADTPGLLDFLQQGFDRGGFQVRHFRGVRPSVDGTRQAAGSGSGVGRWGTSLGGGPRRGNSLGGGMRRRVHVV